MQDNIQSNTVDKLITGINKVCDIIRPTFGPQGSNVVVENVLYPYHTIVNDGKIIVDAIKLVDPIENIGANILREVSDKAENESGDGRKTTMILAQAILNEGTKNKRDSYIDLKKSLDECLPIIYKAIDEQTEQITIDKVGQIATIASESKEIGNIIQDIYTQIGKDGIIELDNSNTFETTYEIKEGVRLRNASFISPYMQTEQGKAVYKKPHILITRQKIATLNDIDPIFQQLANKGVHEIVILCDEIDVTVLSALALTHMKGVFKTLIIQAPKLFKDWIYEDFAKITGATIVEPASGVTLKTVQLSHLGTCDKLISTKDETTVMGIKDITDHIKDLEEQSKTEPQLKTRISWLNTKAAILKLGANSESELSYISKKTKDGRSAAFLALQGGVVSGAGTSFIKAAESLPNTTGGEILKKALNAPFGQIVDNGFVADLDNEFGVPSEIKDPTIVVKNAIKNAISVAGTVLTANAIITLKDTKVNL